MNSNNKTLQGLKKVNDRLLGIETFLLALITILLVAAIFIEVVCRYFLFISAAWAEELTRYLFIWLTYIGSAYAICDNSHTEIDVLKQVLMKIKDELKATSTGIAIMASVLHPTRINRLLHSAMWRRCSMKSTILTLWRTRMPAMRRFATPSATEP